MPEFQTTVKHKAIGIIIHLEERKGKLKMSYKSHFAQEKMIDIRENLFGELSILLTLW